MRFLIKAVSTVLLVSSLGLTGCDQAKQDKIPNDSQKVADLKLISKKTGATYKSLGKGKASFTKKGGETEYIDINAAIEKQGTAFIVEGRAARLIVDWADGYRSAYSFYDTTEKWGEIIDYDKTKPHGKRFDYINATKMNWRFEKDDVVITAENGSITVIGGEKPTVARQIEEIEVGRKAEYDYNMAKAAEQSSTKSEYQDEIVTSGFILSNISIRPYRGNTSNADVAGQLWVASGNVTNNSNETAVPAYSLSLSIQDSQGRSFKEADLTVTMNAILDESFGGRKVLRMTDGVLPGSTRRNVQLGVFDVSPGAQGLRLCAGPMWGRKKCS